MKQLRRSALLLATVGLLSACGFHLRGMGVPLAALPFASLAVVDGDKLGDGLRTALQRDGRLDLSQPRSAADAVLTVHNVEQRKDILTINRGGKVNEYLLLLRVDASVQRRGDSAVPLAVLVRRELSYSDADVLGKEREEALLWADMRRDAAEQLVRRLAYRPAPAGKPADARVKP